MTIAAASVMGLGLAEVVTIVLVSGVILIVVILVGVMLIRPKAPPAASAPPALALLEERYARGEITRDERRAVLREHRG